MTFFYLNKEHCSEFYIERNENNCQGLPNVVEDISVSSPSCQFYVIRLNTSERLV